MQTNKKNVTIALLVATFLTAIEGTIVSTAMPTIVSDLLGFERMNWVFAVYLLTMTAATPIFGKLADLFGRKRMFTIGVILFLIGSALSGMARSMDQLIWFRAFQGLGAGAVLPITMTIIGDIYPFEQRAKIQAYISSVWGIAGVAGPLVGGFFVQQLSWRWIFYINIPFGLISMAMIWAYLHESFDKRKRHIDYAGAATFTIGITALLLALQQGSERLAWNSPDVLALFALAALFIAVFLLIQSRSPEPMMPLKLFRIRGIAVSNAVSFLASMTLIGVTVYIPVWMQGLNGFSPTQAGMSLAPMSVGWMIGAMIGGRLLVKKGARLTSAFGTAILLGSAVWLAAVDMHTPQIVFLVIVFILGTGFGFAFTVYGVVVQSAVDWSLRGAATASNTLLRSLGQTVGIAILGNLFNRMIASRLNMEPSGLNGVSPDDMNRLINPEQAVALPEAVRELLRNVLETGLHNLFIVLAVISLMCLLVTLMLPRPKTMPEPAKANVRQG